jgi:hypothetical protein
MNRNRRHTTEEIDKWLRDDGREYTLVGNYVNALQKTLFQCKYGHQWETTLNKIKNGRGCHFCKGGLNHSDKDFQKWLNDNGNGITSLTSYINSHTKMTFMCLIGHTWEAFPYSIKNGSRCPKCADHSGGGFKPDKPAWAYVFIRDNYIKFGISNNLDRRLQIHNQHGKFLLIYKHYYENGQYAIDWENMIKNEFGGKYATKEQCPDGYTETLSVHVLESVIAKSLT